MVIATEGAQPPIIDAWHLCGNLNCLIDWMDHWQTMITGVGAVSAAAVSIYFLRKQIASTEAEKILRRARRLAAARARLPLFLSEMTSYASAMLRMLKTCLDALASNQPIPSTIVVLKPRPPEQAIDAFAALIEATDDAEFAALIANMISEIQILDARTGDLEDLAGQLGRLSVQTYIMNAAKVSAYASSMYEYARRATDQPPHELDWDAVFSALILNELYDESYPELHAFIVRTRDRVLGENAHA
ncbi:MAG: hypothetical protein ACJ8FO_03220 [Sphingomicrobium sp.]